MDNGKLLEFLSHYNLKVCVKFEVLTGLNMQNSTFWVVIPHSLIHMYHCIGGTSRLHLQCRGVKMNAEHKTLCTEDTRQ
jgi:hypothetical protein